MRVLALKSCDTCRKAIKALAAAGHELSVTDIRADGLSSADIDAVVAQFPDKAMNKASTTWRGLSDEEKEKSPAALLAMYPTLMKRPVIISDVWTIGWDKTTQAQWLGR